MIRLNACSKGEGSEGGEEKPYMKKSSLRLGWNKWQPQKIDFIFHSQSLKDFIDPGQFGSFAGYKTEIKKRKKNLIRRINQLTKPEQ